jgi:single-strand DNA-binding protein
LIGNLTRDPELRVMPSGKTVCHLRVACNRVRRDGDGAWEERPNFFDVSVFGAQAESVVRYLSRGRPVGIDGRLEWREWETPDQQKRQSVSIVADSIQFLGKPDGAKAARDDAESDDDATGEDATEEAAAPETVEAAPVDEALIF